MNFNQLEYFVAVAKSESMSQAARDLNASQPAVSSNIQKLEREIGVNLFDRTGRRVVLNQYGKTFLPTAKSLLSQLEEGLETMRDMQRSEENRIVMCTRAFAYLPSLKSSVYARHPNLSLSNIDCDFADLHDSVKSGDIDFCIVGKSLSTIDLSYAVFYNIPMVMLVSETSRFASVETATLDAFADEEFATLSPDKASGASELDEICHEAGFVPKATFVSSDFADVISEVKYRGNVSWVPERILHQFNLEGAHIVHLEGLGSTSHLTMYWNESVLKNRPVSSEVRKTIEQYFRHTH